jgi:NAD(P)-dependent dehydrogenase (short-subunit alcohol dehydrogenase family)
MSRPFAIVTGGSAGIGLELARLLARDGNDLVIAGSSDRVFDAAAELRALGAEVVAVKSDLAIEAGTDAVGREAAETGRKVDVAVTPASPSEARSRTSH